MYTVVLYTIGWYNTINHVDTIPPSAKQWHLTWYDILATVRAWCFTSIPCEWQRCSRMCSSWIVQSVYTQMFVRQKCKTTMLHYKVMVFDRVWSRVIPPTCTHRLYFMRFGRNRLTTRPMCIAIFMVQKVFICMKDNPYSYSYPSVWTSLLKISVHTPHKHLSKTSHRVYA